MAAHEGGALNLGCRNLRRTSPFPWITGTPRCERRAGGAQCRGGRPDVKNRGKNVIWRPGWRLAGRNGSRSAAQRGGRSIRGGVADLEQNVVRRRAEPAAAFL